ncbi:hypothetical protein LKO27_05810 [Tessaracoccus sp. OS52]|uniref:DUF6767 domain-containing protein n=1 Tax=Tessaracoccus sp. OS52 TaxID=2886691 RepID=UPI001D0F99B6|nr:DUF6767 domain-containing protein [Tessaracoccus sp. OS52]MCC2592929.1 hypothetical protein [Tessaracoccus sp. OS52]
MAVAQAKCPIRLGEPCTLCFPGADGPQNCGLVYLVQSDEDLREARTAYRKVQRERASAPSAAS